MDILDFWSTSNVFSICYEQGVTNLQFLLISMTNLQFILISMTKNYLDQNFIQVGSHTQPIVYATCNKV